MLPWPTSWTLITNSSDLQMNRDSKRGEYNVYSTFQSHEPEFDYLKSLEIEEKINKIRWLERSNPAHFLLSTNGGYHHPIPSADSFPWVLWTSFFADKTIKLWKVSERHKRPEGYNLKDESGLLLDPSSITSLRVPQFKPMELMVEASPRRVFSNAHTYHINSISVNSDQETYMSADDLRINLWHLEITDQSFSILACSPPPLFSQLYHVYMTGGHLSHLLCFCLDHCSLRHRWHQACQHGRTHRGDHSRWVPPFRVQRVCLQQQQGDHPVVWYAVTSALW